MTKLHTDTNLRIVFGVTLMVVLGVSSIFPVFPRMSQELGITPRTIGLLITAFTVPGVFLTPVMGILADRFGRKTVLVPSLLLFAFSGTACAFAPDFTTLVMLRLLQGVGAAALGVLSGTLLGDLYQGRDLATATGYNAGVLAMGTAIYPAVGGILGTLGWRYPFALPILALPLAYIVLRYLDVAPVRNNKGMFSYIRNAAGLMNTRLVKGLFLSSLITFVLLYGPLVTFYPLLLGDVFHASPAQIGLLVSVSSLFTGLASSQLGKITQKVHETTLIKIAFGFYALSFGITPLIPSFGWFLLPITLFGLAQGMNIPSAMTLLNRIAPTEYRAAFMAANATLLRIGQSIGPLLFGLAYAYGGMPAVFYTGAFMAVLMAFGAIILLHEKTENQ